MVQAVENHVYAFPNTEGAKVNFKERMKILSVENGQPRLKGNTLII